MANDKDNSVWDKTKNAAKEGANVVSDTFDVIGDAASNTAKRVTGERHTSMETAVEKGD
ncbi:hypothetical protein RAC89_26240 [Paenibacillus sp. GD4]|uniref:hypothetical protein n=1 Tax=Paenibacillus TaxID=44249 RepID=UPI002543F0B4|nr:MULTISPECIES: hypothetical protein [Paenibacillus]MDQ1913906.1 hypothetical protein [Paenibacillus sp. GD4]